MPVLPFTVNEYAVIEKDQLPQGLDELKTRDWGLLFCTDAQGVHWTLLGDDQFCRELQAVDGTRGISHEIANEFFPLSDFTGPSGYPAYLARGWPDEWPQMPGPTMFIPREALAAYDEDLAS